MKIKIKHDAIKYILLILPFFPLYSMDMFVEAGVAEPLFYGLSRLFAFSRWIITGYLIIETLLKRRKLGVVSKFIILFVFIRCIACVMSGHYNIGLLIGNITYIGFTCLVEKLIQSNKSTFVDANRQFFGIISYVAIIFIIIFPYGFLHASSKDNAIYLLGSKNAGFYYYIIFIFFMVLRMLDEKNRVTKQVLVFITLASIGAIVTASANTLICLLIVLVYFMLERFIAKKSHLIEPKKVIIAIILLGLVFVSGKNIPVINDMLMFFGRDLTFTGRDYIWTLNIQEFLKNPLWGVGYDFEVKLMNGIAANHAHNFFLDNLVKYGVFEFATLVIVIFCMGRGIALKTNKKLIVYFAVILFIILLHSLLDDLSIYMMILIFVTMDLVGDKKSKVLK